VPGTIAAMRIATAIVTSLLLSASAALGAAPPLAVGARLPALTLTDQHDVEGSVGPGTRCILFSRDMSAAKIVNEALANDPAALIAAAQAVVVSDISGMPKLITKLFALPAMRRRSYRLLLDRDGNATAGFPYEKGKVTVLHLHALTVERVEYIESAGALRAVLRQAAEAGSPEPRAGYGRQ
jgi:hypothetical protein